MIKLVFDKETKIIYVYEINEEVVREKDETKEEFQEHNEIQKQKKYQKYLE